jgi:hypothetical protein
MSRVPGRTWLRPLLPGGVGRVGLDLHGVEEPGAAAGLERGNPSVGGHVANRPFGQAETFRDVVDAQDARGRI